MTKSPNASSLTQEGSVEWLQATSAKPFAIQNSAEDTKGSYTTLEIVADHRNGVEMHIHEEEDEHFVVLEGTAHVAAEIVYGTPPLAGKALRCLDLL